MRYNNDEYREGKDINVCFHIGHGYSRSGKYYNQGYKTYVPYVESISELFGNAVIEDYDEDGNPLPDVLWKLMDSTRDKVLLTGRVEIENETGILEWDGPYNTDIVQSIHDCTKDDNELLIEAYNNEDPVHISALCYAADALGMLIAEEVKVYRSNATVHLYNYVNKGPITLQRDAAEEIGEEGYREMLQELGFVDRSVDEIISNLEMYEWFDNRV